MMKVLGHTCLDRDVEELVLPIVKAATGIDIRLGTTCLAPGVLLGYTPLEVEDHVDLEVAKAALTTACLFFNFLSFPDEMIADYGMPAESAKLFTLVKENIGCRTESLGEKLSAYMG